MTLNIKIPIYILYETIKALIIKVMWEVIVISSFDDVVIKINEYHYK